MKLRIAIVSDMHCHKNEPNREVNSYIITNKKVKIENHPYKSFQNLIKEEENRNTPILADILLMPGDYTDKCDSDGIKMGWKITQEIGELLKVKQIIPNIGNHDVVSRQRHTNDKYSLINSLNNFPFEDLNLNNHFKKEGFVFIEGSNFRILNINTVFNHKNKTQADKGLISKASLNKIESYLNTFPRKTFNIIQCHHNLTPIEDENSGSTDFVHNGSLLIEIASKYDYQIIIHGHKHNVKMLYSQGSSGSTAIFSSGSFAIAKKNLLSGGYNMFHIIELIIDDNKQIEGTLNRGFVYTWFFKEGKGWLKELNNEYISHKIGFGTRMLNNDIASKINNWFKERILPNKEYYNFNWNDLLSEFEIINYMLPQDQKKLRLVLEQKYKIYTDREFADNPTIVTKYP